jgi:ketosteroid isomerase-like protein
MIEPVAAGVPPAVRAINDALESGSLDGAVAMLAPGAVLWHNDDKVEMDAAEGIARVAGLHELVDDVQLEVVQLEPVSTGWFQRIVLRGKVRASGHKLAAHNCAVIGLSDDGRITRIDEYVDPTMLAQLGV